jgi:regulator of replication initiation timing
MSPVAAVLLLLYCYAAVQAKIQDLHQQIEELTQKVGNLQTENAALHSRTSILEKVLDMRNEQIQVMQESKEVSD